MKLASALRVAHERFMSQGPPTPVGDGKPRIRQSGVRRIVMDSWLRSRLNGVDPERSVPPFDFAPADLRAYRQEHVLAPLMPMVRRLLLDGTGSDGLIVALTDSAGHLLWVEGDRGVRRDVERVGFVEGARWGEQDAGTNAPGMALATDHEVQIFAAEHFTRAVHPWSCTAAPVHDPTTGRLLGVLDITGRELAASPLMLSLVRATVSAMESALAVRALRAATTSGRFTAARPRHAWHLEALGTSSPVLARAGVRQTLTLRHAELLLLLRRHPSGLTADGLAALLYDGTASSVTVRAEISRLRRSAGALLTQSRPYRLADALGTDFDDVRDLLARGNVLGAIQAYPGPVLPQSQAPGIVTIRDELAAELHAALIRTRDRRALELWTHGDAGSDDWEAWRQLLALLPEGTPAWIRARARADALDRELRAPAHRVDSGPRTAIPARGGRPTAHSADADADRATVTQRAWA